MASRASPVSVEVCKYEMREKEARGKRYAAYVCRVQVDGPGQAPWYILRRYKQWEELLDDLQDEVGRAKLPSLPGKKMFGNMEPKFLETRQRDLQTWVTEILRDSRLRESDTMWNWLKPLPEDKEYGRSSSPAELVLESGPPAMQGTLELVDSTSGFVTRWFELRGTVLAWFVERDGERIDVVDLGDAVVSTSRALQNDPARIATGIGLVAPNPGSRSSFFSITSRGNEYVVGADSEDEMRAWVSAILNQQGDKQGAAAFAMGRSSISSHSTKLSAPVEESPDLLDSFEEGDPLGAEDPLGAVREELPIQVPGPSLVTANAQLGAALEADFRQHGGVVARVQVKFAVDIIPVCTEGEPEPEPEGSIVTAGGSHMLCVCQLDSEFGVVHIHRSEVSHELCTLATIPVVATLEYSQPDDSQLVLSDPQLTEDGSFSFAFANRQSVDDFVTKLQELRRVAKGAGQLQINDRTHQWLKKIDQIGSRQTGAAPTESDTATALLSGSSAFWTSTDESYLLDPERRRRLKSSACADSTGAQHVQLLPHETFGQGTLEQGSLQTRTEIRDGKKVTVYELALDRDGFRWTVSRRYSDFVSLQDALKASWPDVIKRLSAHFPSKGVRSSTDPEAIFQRSTQLFSWLNALMKDPQATRAKELISFLGMKLTTDTKTVDVGNTFWRPGQIGHTDAQGSTRQRQRQRQRQSTVFASVDQLGRSITQLINEQSSLAPPREVSQQIAECRAFRDALLTQTFDAKRLDGGGGKVRLELLGDHLCIAGPTPRDAQVEAEPYAAMVISFDPPILTLTSSDTEAAKRFQIGGIDGPRIVAELDDRIQLARHMLHKEEQLKLSQFDSRDLQPNYADSGRGHLSSASEYRRKLDELSGKTEPERIAAAVDKILSGSSAADQREIARPLQHFLQTTFRTLLDEPDTVAKHVREVMTDLQETILDPDGDRYTGLVTQLAEPNSEALENLTLIVNERLELVVVAPIVEQIDDCLTRSFRPAHLQRVDAKREALRANTQEYFGIAADSTSPSGWRAAIDEVNKIAQHQMPSSKLHALLCSTTKIYDLFTAEQSARASAVTKHDDATNPPTDRFLAADEFLSVFIFVLVQSTLQSLPVTCRFMSELCDPELLSGQHGYYLTVFESAIQCIADSDADRDLISAVARTSSSISRNSGMSPKSAMSAVENVKELVSLEEQSSDDDINAGRPVDSPLSTGHDSDEDVELFAGPKQHVAAVIDQDDLEDSPLFRTAISDSRLKKVPGRGHPGRTTVLLPASDDDDDDEQDAMSKSIAGQWMQAAETAFQRVSSAASVQSSGNSSEASDWRHSLMGSEPDSSAGEGDAVLSPPPRISSSDIAGAVDGESRDEMVQ